MAANRRDFQMVLLQDGKVLAAGGFNGTTAINSAEVYDSSTGAWSSAGTLSETKYRQGMVLLNNGKVLAAGGFNGTAPTNSADLYDPSTNSWSQTGAMHDNRQMFGLVLLGNGKVLAANGSYGARDDSVLSSAEIYDPATEAWSSTNSSSGAVKSAGYVVLSSSPTVTKVLRVGGQNLFNASEASAEIYDSSTGTWSTTGSLFTGRFGGAVVKLNSGDVIAIGGYSGTAYLNSTEKYSVANGTWSSDAAMVNGRTAFRAVLLPSTGTVVVEGGFTGVADLNGAEVYTP